MKIYRIFKQVVSFEWSPYTDDMMQVQEQETIKYVDSKDKVDAFLKEIADKNQIAEKCLNCPIIRLSKRQFSNGKHDDMINSYCDKRRILFQGNKTFCSNEKPTDFAEYDYEEIDVK